MLAHHLGSVQYSYSRIILVRQRMVSMSMGKVESIQTPSACNLHPAQTWEPALLGRKHGLLIQAAKRCGPAMPLSRIMRDSRARCSATAQGRQSSPRLPRALGDPDADLFSRRVVTSTSRRCASCSCAVLFNVGERSRKTEQNGQN